MKSMWVIITIWEDRFRSPHTSVQPIGYIKNLKYVDSKTNPKYNACHRKY
jgi:hypothetical protein